MSELIAISMPIFIRKLAQVRVVLSSKSSVSSEPNAIWGIGRSQERPVGNID